jgi:hypothetical protein
VVDYAEERRLIVAAKSGDTAALGQLYQLHYGFIRKLALYYRDMAPQNEAEDYFQAGYVALEVAVAGFDLGRGVRFLTWLGWQLRRECQELMSNGLIRIPRTEWSNKGRNPVIAAHAARARAARRMPLGGVDHAAFDEFCLMDRGMAAVDGADWWAAVRRRVYAIYDYWQACELRSTAMSGHYDTLPTRRVRLPHLATRKAEIILMCIQGYGAPAVGRVFGISRERVRQIQKEFIRLAARYNAEPALEAKYGYGKQMVR